MIRDYSKLNELPDDAVLLSTGDPMLAGLGRLGEEVVPGISSMQCAFSRLRLPMTRAVVVDAHGKDQEAAMREMLEEVERGRTPFVLTGPDFDISGLARMMVDANVECTMIVLENLGYRDEIISFGDARHPPSAASRLFSLILVKDA
jgi:cobalt-precorrin-7 (C5)-methyltransferase